MNLPILLIKKHISSSALQLYLFLQGVSQPSASYGNPRLLPSKNLTVRNLSARRLKPEECYCSGHSCTSAGLATAATACVSECLWGRGWRKEGREESKVWRRQLYVFPLLCGLRTKKHIVDSELTHSSGLDGGMLLSTPLPTLCLSLCFFESDKYGMHAQKCRQHRTYVCKAQVAGLTHRWCKYVPC